MLRSPIFALLTQQYLGITISFKISNLWQIEQLKKAIFHHPIPSSPSVQFWLCKFCNFFISFLKLQQRTRLFNILKDMARYGLTASESCV